MTFHGCNSEGFLDTFLGRRLLGFRFVSILVAHKMG